MATFSRRCNKILYHPLLQVHYNHSVSSLRSAQSSLNLHTIINSTSIQSKNGKRITAINQSNLIRPCAFSSYMTEDDNTIKKYKEVIKSFSFQVPSFGGKVTASSPLDITVRSADPAHYHNLDQAFVRLLAEQKSNKHSPKLNVTQDGPKLTVQCDSDKTSLQSNYKVDVEVPIVHNVKVSALDSASVDIYEFIESNYVDIHAEKGNVRTQQIKTENLTIHTDSGDVLCEGTLQGDVKITSNSGNIISSKRFMGPNVELETENGDIRVASSYSDQAKFSSNKGSMNLRNIHNESYVAIYEEGDVNIQGLDGSTNIFIKKGDLDIHVSRIRHESRIHVEDGDIRLRITDSYPIKLSIDANEVIPDAQCSEYGKVEKKLDGENQHFFAAIEPNKFSPTLVIVAENGSVEVEMQDWATSFGVKLRS